MGVSEAVLQIAHAPLLGAGALDDPLVRPLHPCGELVIGLTTLVELRARWVTCVVTR